MLPAIRPELGALSVALAVAVLGRPWADAVEARLAAVGPWTGRRTAVVVALLVAWLALAWAVPAKAPPASWGSAQWLLGGLHPTSPHGLLLPLVLLGAAPLGLVVLAVRGAAVALAHPIRTGLLPMAVWAMFVTARVAAHGRPALVGVGSLSAWELYRYLLVLLPPVALLAVIGARAASASSTGVRVAVGLACLLPAVPEVTRLLDVDGGGAWPRRFGIDRDPQVEIRALAARLEEAPSCGVLTLGHAWGGPPGPDRFGWAALVPRTHGDLPAGFRYVRPKPGTLPATADAATAAKALLGDVGCAVAWRSLDCAEVHGPGCGPLDALPTLDVRAIEHRPFVHPRHGARWDGPLVVGWAAIPGVDPGPGWATAAR
jgi:hypothetical protein